MLEVITSQTNKPVLRRDGKFLASGYDPIKEAENFLQPYLAWCEQKPILIVFGAGSGYHLRMLAEMFPQKQIILFEVDQAVVKAVHELHPGLSFEHTSIITDELVSRLRAGAVLLRHYPSWTGREADFEAAWTRCKSSPIIEKAQRIENGPKPFRDDDILWLCLRELFK